MQVARRYLVSGRVQGVGFRYFVREAADREGVRGWVRNLIDGRVEAVARGDADAMAHFESALRNGPAMSRVGRVDVHDEPLLDEEPGEMLKGFEVRATAAI